MKSLLKFTRFIFLCLLCNFVINKAVANSEWNEYEQTGKASYYADKYQNRKTASGALYQHNLKTAAHKKLPLGTEVRVTNLANGKSVIVKINDRGPFVKGRIIDLSKSAFSAIGNTSFGLLEVKMEVIGSASHDNKQVTEIASNKSNDNNTQTGKASYYADKYQNRKTASGALYQHDLKTAAHKKLPFGTKVRVTNLENGKSVIVKINDRGPFVKGRIIDLSKSAFSAIGSTSSGLLKVKMEVI